MFELPNISTRIRADLSPLKADFAQAQGMAKGYAGGIGGAFSGLAGAIASPIGAIVASFTAAIGAAVSLRAAINAVSSAMETIDAAGKASDRLSMTTEAYVALQHQAKRAGVDMGAVEQAVNRVNVQIGESIAGNKKAAAAFGELGLSAEELAGISPEQALGKIGDALNAIENPAQRARLEAELLGQRLGPQLRGLLSEGVQGIEAGMRRAEELHIALSRVDAEKVAMANDAMTDLKAVIGGVAQRIAVELAPYIRGVADLFTNAAKEGGGFGDAIATAIEYGVKGVAYMADRLSFLQAMWHGVSAVVKGVAAGVLYSIDQMGQAVADLANLVGVEMKWDRSFKVMGDSMVKQARESAAAALGALADGLEGKNSKAVEAWAEHWRKITDQDAQDRANRPQGGAIELPDLGSSGIDKAAQTIGSMRRDVDMMAMKLMGLDDLDIQLVEFKGTEGVTADQVKQYEELVKQAKSFREQMDVRSEVDRWRDSLKGPADKLEEMYETLVKWRDMGAISLEDFERGIEDLDEKAKALQGGDKKDRMGVGREAHLASFINAGSADAMRLQFQNSLNLTQKDEIPKRQLVQAERQTRKLEELVNRFEKLTVV